MTAANWYAFGAIDELNLSWYTGYALDIEFYNDFSTVGDCTVDWGDGSTDTISSNYYYPASHTWAAAGNYLITFTITDSTGTATGSLLVHLLTPTSYANPATPIVLGDAADFVLDFHNVPVWPGSDTPDTLFKDHGNLRSGRRIAWLRYTASATDTWMLELTAQDDIEENVSGWFDVIDTDLDILQGTHDSPGARPWNVTIGGTPLQEGHTYLIGVEVYGNGVWVGRWHRQVPATGGKVMLVAQAFTDPVVMAVKPGSPQTPLFQPATGEERTYIRDIKVTDASGTAVRYHWRDGVVLVNTISGTLSGDPGWGGTFTFSAEDTEAGYYRAVYIDPFTDEEYYSQESGNYTAPHSGEVFTATWFTEFTSQISAPITPLPTISAAPVAWYGAYFDYPSNVAVDGSTLYLTHESWGSGVAKFSGTKWLNGYPAPWIADTDLGPGLEGEWILWDSSRSALMVLGPSWPIELLPWVSDYAEANRYIMAFNEDGLVDYWRCEALGQHTELGTHTVTEFYARQWNGFVVDGNRVWVGGENNTHTYSYDGYGYSDYTISRDFGYAEIRLNDDHTADIVNTYVPTLTDPSTNSDPGFLVSPDRTKMLCLYSRNPGEGFYNFNEWYIGGAWIQVYDIPSMELLTEFRYLPYPNVAGTHVSADGWGNYNFFFYPTMCIDDDNVHLWMINGAYHDDADVMHNFLFKIPLFGDPDVRYASMREPVAIWQPADFTDTPDWRFGTLPGSGGWSVGVLAWG